MFAAGNLKMQVPVRVHQVRTIAYMPDDKSILVPLYFRLKQYQNK